MRTDEQIIKLEKFQSSPLQLFHFLTQERVDELLEVFHDSKDIEEKSTGPRVLYVKPGDGILDDVFDRITAMFDCSIRNAQIFEVERPHIIHIDDGKELPNSFKAFTIPLHVENGIDTDAKLVFFDQYYYGGPAKFVKGRVPKRKHYNDFVEDYSKVDGVVDAPMPDKIYDSLLTHLDRSWLSGLTVQRYFPWNIGSCIMFDSLQLHCASDFRAKGITKKIGCSIFTIKD